MTNQNKHALLIGINKYSNLPPHYQLSGCINDVEMITSVLKENFGFPESNIKMLRDEQATREGILAAFKALTNRIAENDIAVIHYSGHGSQIRDREGDEPDGWDETIVPNDSGRGSYPNRDITDDEIYVWLLELTEKTPHVTLIFDCCNSGTISRDAFGTKSRWVEPDMRPVEELPPSPVLKQMKGASRDVGPSGWLPLGKRYVLIAGCRDSESSYEHNIVQEGVSVSHGAMTYFLSRELTKAEPGATYRDIFERASTYVTTHYPYQHPQLEGARDRELFGICDNQPTYFISVRQRSGDKLTLGAGAAHGMTVHSKWAVYPQATRQITNDTRRLGLIEITQVNAVTSYARISHEAQNGIIEVNSRAVEEEHFYGHMKLKVEISPGKYGNDANKLSERVRKSALLSFVETGEIADVRAYIIASRTDVRKGDPVPQLKVVDKPVWIVVGQDGRLLMPIHEIDEASVVSILVDNLEKVARYRQAILLRNPDEGSLLKGKVDFILKRKTPDGTWVTAEPDNAGGYIKFEEGEFISCEVVNHHDSPIYISILDFGLTGAVTLFYPVAGSNEALEQGRSIQIGARQGDAIELFIPENFPYFLDPEDTMPIGGIETLKLFATTHEADFSPLIQQGFRSLTRGSGKPLIQLLNMALTGHGTRDARRNRVSSDEEWTTIEHSFFLRKKPHLFEKTRSINRNLETDDKRPKIDMAKPIQEPEELRFIQSRVFHDQENEPIDNAFIEGEQYCASVRIGPSDESWLTLKKSFPQHLLPDMEKHTLQVFFSEPNHILQVQAATIELSRRGPSTECQFLFSVKKQIPLFEGRIIVAYKNRILQTAMLKGEVVETLAMAGTRKSIRLEMEAVVRPNVADLSGRPKFDLALLINHGSDDKHRLTKLAEDRASIRDIEGIQASIKNIQERLESAARAIADADIPEGTFRSEETETLLNFLAYHGRILYDAIITDQVDAGWLPRHIGRVQLVSAHAEAFLPLEFLYEKPSPSLDAKLCPKSEQALKEGKCQECLLQDDMTYVPYICPIGFWCLSRVIERHAHDASYGTMLGSSDYVMQSEPVDDRMDLQVLKTCLYAASNRVDSVVPGQTKQFLNTLNSVSNNAGTMVSMWNDWTKEVASKHPTFLILMPHTLEDERLKAPVMEIGASDRLVSGLIRPGFVCTSPEDQPPIVALLGCETMVPYSKYMGFVPQFRRNGAALVLSTLTTVLGRQVVPIASKLMEELKMELDGSEGHAISFGDVMLNVRRKIMLQGLPIVLCLVAFGDADWRLVGGK